MDKLISIKSVLYELSDIIPENYWNETRFMEWAAKAARQIGGPKTFVTKLVYLVVEGHKTVLPSNLIYINQIAYKTDVSESDLNSIKHILNLDSVTWSPAITHMENPDGLAEKALQSLSASLKTKWRPFRKNTNLFFKSVLCDDPMFPHLEADLNCLECNQTYNIEWEGVGVITTSFSKGLIAISYLARPESDEGDILIPDNETFKEAVLNYCLSKYYLKKDIVGEANADKKAMMYKQQFGILKAKAIAELNAPSLDEMENIKNMTTRLLPRSNQFNGFFNNLNGRENLRY